MIMMFKEQPHLDLVLAHFWIKSQAVVTQGVERSSTNRKVGGLIPDSSRLGKVSLSKTLNPKMISMGMAFVLLSVCVNG